jgi:APA family basic amino acid/polyamine antiporter
VITVSQSVASSGERAEEIAPVRALGVLDAAFLVTGSIIGAGIFFVGQSVAKSVSSPAGFLGVWLAGGLLALAGALSNGELGGLFPRGGGEYVFLREAYGARASFLSGWTSFWINFPGSVAALAFAFGTAVGELIGARSSVVSATVGLVAVVALTILNAFGIRAGKWTQNTLSGAKLIAFAGLLVAGAFLAHGGEEHFTPFFAPERSGDLASALIPIFFAYTGWNAATYVAGEIRDATKTLGRSLVLGTLASLALYVAINAVYLRALPLERLREEPDLARATLVHLFSPRVASALTAIVALSTLSSLQATILTGPRIYQAMAHDRIFFAPLAQLHPKSRVPVRALATQGVIASLLLLTGSFDILLRFATFGIVLFATATVAAVIVLRIRRPELPRPFRTPLYPIVPLVFVASNGWVLWNVAFAGMKEAVYGLAIIATGLPAFELFRRQGSAPRP